jgi:RNA polymerase sigma-70 factor (ECF subfamily)
MSQTLGVQQLFVRHQSAIKAFVLSLLPHFSEAEDVLQETFLTVTQKAAEFQEGSNFVAWACMIARFKVLEARRRSSRRMLSPEVIDVLTVSVPDEVFDVRRLQALSGCLGRLSPRLRQLIELRYHREQLPGEIARGLSRTVNSVNVALAKARGALRECVERELRRQEAT